MARKKSPIKTRVSSTRVRRRKKPSLIAPDRVVMGIGRFGLPLLISGLLLAALGVLGFSFYTTATGSDFFHIRSIEVRGNDHTSAEDVRRLVAADVEKSGVWNADLATLRAKVEKFPYVKSASVSRVLPVSIRIDIIERAPAAVVHLS